MARRQKSELPLGVRLLILFLIAALGLVVRQALIQNNARVAEQARSTTSSRNPKREFIKRLAPYAQELHQEYGVFASITLAQAILESDWGRSQLAKDYHNLFGVKGEDPAKTKLLTTKEYVNDEWITIKARFVVYPSDEASMKAHALLFIHGTAWNPNQYQHVLAAKNYRAAARALQTDAYATDPAYPQKLIALIEEWDLAQYD